VYSKYGKVYCDNALLTTNVLCYEIYQRMMGIWLKFSQFKIQLLTTVVI